MTEAFQMADRLPRQPGVYQIRNTASGRVYVGSSVNVRLRCRRHLRFLQRGTHDSWLLQAAWAKHGPEVFALDLLEECDRASRFEREEYWIAKLGAYMGEGGYNILPHAGTVKGLKQTVTPQKREALTQGIRKYWASMTPAERRVREQEIAAATARDFTVTFPDGREEEVFNLKQFCRTHGLVYNAMKKAARFQQNAHRGYRVRPAGMGAEEAKAKCREVQTAVNAERWARELKRRAAAK